MDYNSLYKISHRENVHHFQNLLNIVYLSRERLEGNCFGDGFIVNEVPDRWLSKQANLYHAGLNASNILEIGVNCGYSALIFLIANPLSKLTLFDIGEHRYTRPCVDYLQSNFPNRITIYYGNSLVTVPEYYKNNPNSKFDVIHIDGGHGEDVIRGDITNCHLLASPNNTVFSDDDDVPHINAFNREMVNRGVWKIKEGFYETYACPHYVTEYIV